jgi:hypothetical protein
VLAKSKKANVRIHVKRVIGAVRQKFSILSATGTLPKEFYQQKSNGVLLLDAVVRVINNCIIPFD